MTVLLIKKVSLLVRQGSSNAFIVLAAGSFTVRVNNNSIRLPCSFEQCNSSTPPHVSRKKCAPPYLCWRCGVCDRGAGCWMFFFTFLGLDDRSFGGFRRRRLYPPYALIVVGGLRQKAPPSTLRSRNGNGSWVGWMERSAIHQTASIYNCRYSFSSAG